MANQRVHGGKQTAGTRYNIFFCLFGYHLFFFYESEDIKHRDEGAAVQPTGTAALIRAKRVSFKIGRWQVGVQTQHGVGGGREREKKGWDLLRTALKTLAEATVADKLIKVIQ